MGRTTAAAALCLASAGRTYAYERGASATIPRRWDDKKNTLTIGRRSGSFDGMLAKRQFRVVVVAKGRAQGHSPAPTVAREVCYEGRAVVVPLPR